MPAYTLAQAITATGKSRATLIRAIRSGKLSASRGEGGAYLVDPSELHRIFPVTNGGTPLAQANGVPWHAGRFEAEQAKVALLQDQVEDLRRRLDDSERERREQAARLVGLLGDSRVPASGEPSRPRRKWLPWRRR